METAGSPIGVVLAILGRWPHDDDPVRTSRRPTTTGQTNALYVSPTGSDTADGRTSQSALETLARALQIVQPGETVRLLPGVYVESMEVTLRGMPGRPITITGEGGVPVLSGNRQLRTGLWCEECAYVRVENLEIRDYRDIGLLVVLSEQVTLDRLRVHHNGFSPSISWVEGYGLHLDESSNLTIQNNEVYHNGPDPRSPVTVGTGINAFRDVWIEAMPCPAPCPGGYML